MGCLYCDSLDSWIDEGRVIYNTEHVVGSIDVHPGQPGHILIFPKRHVESIRQLTVPERSAYLLAEEDVLDAFEHMLAVDPEKLHRFYDMLKHAPPTQKAAELSDWALSHPYTGQMPLGYHIGVNYGKAAGQRIAHIHRHFMPVYTEGLGVVTAVRKHRIPIETDS